MEERAVDKECPFPTDDQAAEVAEPGKGALDDPAPAIASELAPVLGLGPRAIAAVGTDQVKAAVGESLPQGVGVVSAVRDHPLRLFLGFDGIEGRLRERDFRWRCRGKLASQRKTLAVDHHHPLRAFPPLGLAHSIAPPLAGAKLASRKASCQSSVPFALSCARKARQISSHSPSSSQRRNRRQQVEGLGYPSGRSAQGAPVRRIHRMPSNTSRLSRQGRPPFAPIAISGKRGPILAHIASVKNCLRAMVLPSMTQRPHLGQFLQCQVMK
jgi:hypothetical protein